MRNENYERPPVDPLPIDEPEGQGHIEADEPPMAQILGKINPEDGPTYERDQIVHGKEVHPGGSTDPNDSLGHTESDESR